MNKFKIGHWIVSPGDCTLADGAIKQEIEPKAMDLLVLLAEANGELVTRQHIMEVIWEGRFVTDYALNNLISSLRKHLSKNSPNDFIKTRPKLGYQLIQPINRLEECGQSSPFNDEANSERPELELVSSGQVAEVKGDRLFKVTVTAVVSMLLLVLIYRISAVSEEQKESSIAVLPFSVLAEDADIEFFADGLAEELIHQLTTLPEFRVISRTSSFAYKNKPVTLHDVGDKLGVNYILQGSVRREDALLKVNIQLVDIAKDNAIWSQSFAASLDHALSIQHQISYQVATTLGGDFTDVPRGKKRYKPASNEAYLHVLRGRKFNQIRTSEKLLQARDEFLMATMLEPGYAEAYVDLAISYLLMAQNKMLTLAEANKEAKQAIGAAIELNPELPEAYAARGILAYNNNQIEQAKEAFEKALELNDSLYIALVNYGNLLRSYFQKEEALPFYEKAVTVAPLSGPAHWGIGSILLGLGRIDEAISRYKLCINRLPGDTNCMLGLAYVLRLADQHASADQVFAELSEISSSQEYYYQMARAWHWLWTGEQERAGGIYDSLLSQYGFNIEALQSISLVNHWFNEDEQWFAQLKASDLEKSLAVNANMAVSAYFNDNCTAAVPMFERLSSSNPELLVDLDILANGISYPAMLTYCYVKLGKNEEAKSALALYESVIARLPANKNMIPGFAYARAQYFKLVGDENRAMKEIEALRGSQWSLAWLIDKNPLFSESLAQSASLASDQTKDSGKQ